MKELYKSKILLLSKTYPILCLFLPKDKGFVGFLVVISIHRISDDPKVRTHGIFRLILGFY